MSDFLSGLVADFHKFVDSDKAKAQAAFLEVKKIFGFDDAAAKAYVDARKPEVEAAVKADVAKVEADAKVDVKAAVPVVEKAAETAVADVVKSV